MAEATDRQQQRDALAETIETFCLATEPLKEDAFNRLALDVFAYQFNWNAPFRRFCQGRAASPETVTSWRDIPAAPAAAFKRFALTCALEQECTPEHGGRVFHSSGTTGAETSRHYMDEAALRLYRVSLRAGWERLVQPPILAPILALMPTPDDAPHSSLSFMLDELNATFFWGDEWGERLTQRLRTATEPVIVFGTAFAWVHFLDALNETIFLPRGSLILETGGFKGRSREVGRAELYDLFHLRLGAPMTNCLSEYGMSEMASQFYDSTRHDVALGGAKPLRKIAPPWLKTRVIDPITGTDAEPGKPGLLAHYDLCNLNSVLAIQTEDQGIIAADGDGFTLLGRAPDAVLRGCSLMAEELLTALDASHPEHRRAH